MTVADGDFPYNLEGDCERCGMPFCELEGWICPHRLKKYEREKIDKFMVCRKTLEQLVDEALDEQREEIIIRLRDEDEYELILRGERYGFVDER